MAAGSRVLARVFHVDQKNPRKVRQPPASILQRKFSRNPDLSGCEKNPKGAKTIFPSFL